MREESPFSSLPDGLSIADYFVKDCLRNFDGQGAEGIPLWRDGRDYSYAWMEAHVDHDLEQYVLLEVRTNVDEKDETRDYLYVFVGLGGRLECEWFNQPIKFAASHDEHIDHLNAGLKWFIDHVIGATETFGEQS